MLVCLVSTLKKKKGIITTIRSEEEAPYDKYGNKVDLIMDPTSIPGRMNPGRLYEMYFGAASRNARRIIREELKGPVDTLTDAEINKVFKSVLEATSMLDTEQHQYYLKATMDDKREILTEIQESEFRLLYKISSKKKSPEVVKSFENSRFRVPKEPIKIGDKWSKEGITIGNIYLILLSKTADGYLSSSSPRVNHYNIPVRTNNSTKTNMPYLNNPTKVYSETERRLFAAYCKSPILAAELQDRAGNIDTHKEIIRAIHASQRPTDIEEIVNREEIPYGGDSAIKLINGIFNSTGVDIKYVEGKQ